MNLLCDHLIPPFFIRGYGGTESLISVSYIIQFTPLSTVLTIYFTASHDIEIHKQDHYELGKVLYLYRLSL